MGTNLITQKLSFDFGFARVGGTRPIGGSANTDGIFYGNVVMTVGQQ